MLMIVLIIILLLAFGGGGGYYGYQRWVNGRRRRNLWVGPHHSGPLLRVRRNAYAPLKFGGWRARTSQATDELGRLCGRNPTP